jgi:hypothetical protein
MKSVKTAKDTITEFESSPERIRQILESVGSKIGNVHFIKRSNGELRKMSYRLHVRNPKHIPSPSGNGNRRQADISNDTMTVYSTNDVVRDRDGNITGRGAYKRIPLDGVTRIVANGKVYEIQRQGIVV